MKKSKITDRLTAALFCLFLFGFAAAFLLTPDRESSEEENRPLAQLPAFSLTALADGTFANEMNTYFADQFPLRDRWIGIKGVTELALGKGENNGVLLTENDRLAVRRFRMYKSRLERIDNMDYYSTATVERAIAGVNALAASLGERGGELVTLLPPRAVDYLSAASGGYPTEISDALDAQLAGGLSEAARYVPLRESFRARMAAGEELYYRTDHHWTTLGAYYAYRAVMETFGMAEQTLPREAFAVEAVPDFYGTTWSKAGMRFVPPDTLELWTLGNEAQFTTEILQTRTETDANGETVYVRDTIQRFSSFWNREKLQTKDKYAAFLDGPHNEVTVMKTDSEKADVKRERLLVVKDSFANALVPFLAQHFDIVMINLADGITDVSAYVAAYACDRVLLVYNWENIVTGDNLAALE